MTVHCRPSIELEMQPAVPASVLSSVNARISARIASVNAGRASVNGLLDSAAEAQTLRLDYEPEIATLWITMRHPGRPCFTPRLIAEFNALAAAIRLMHGRSVPSPDQPLKFVVFRSASDQVFNLGGDLGHFAEVIAEGDAAAMQAYGRAGAEACRAFAWGFDASLVTISLVRGIALGGGLEVARCCDVMVAEEGASFQLPEAAFGLFAASGVLSVISPRIGHKATRRLVIDGERLDCAGALAIDLVDEVAPTGGGETQVRALIARLAPRHAAAVATYRGLNRTNGATGEALLAEADVWARAAMNVSPESLAMMRRLSRAQARRFSTEQGVERCR